MGKSSTKLFHTMESMKLRARRTIATAVTLTRALMAKAKEAADIEVRARVKKKIKNLETSTVNPENIHQFY